MNQCPIYGQDSWVQEPRGGSGNDSIYCYSGLLPVPATLCSASLEVLVLPGDTKNIPMNWKLRLPAGYFGLLMPGSQQTRKD